MGVFSGLTKTIAKATTTPKKKSKDPSSTASSDSLQDGVKDDLKDKSEDPLGASGVGSSMGEHAAKKAKIDKSEDPHPKGGSAIEKFLNKGAYDRKNEERGKSIMGFCGTSVDYTLKHCRGPFMEFCEKEFSGENIEVYEAILGGVPPRSVYKTWIETELINLPGQVKAVLDDHASKDQWDMMDLIPVKKEMGNNLVDTITRFIFDKDSIKKVGAAR